MMDRVLYAMRDHLEYVENLDKRSTKNETNLYIAFDALIEIRNETQYSRLSPSKSGQIYRIAQLALETIDPSYAEALDDS